MQKHLGVILITRLTTGRGGIDIGLLCLEYAFVLHLILCHLYVYV